MTENPPLYVARFISHPLGADRYAKDFRHNLTGYGRDTWWKFADEERRKSHFEWALNHKQYHYSTDDLQKADWWRCNDDDAADRAILAEYAPVEYIEVFTQMVDPKSVEEK